MAGKTAERLIAEAIAITHLVFAARLDPCSDRKRQPLTTIRHTRLPPGRDAANCTQVCGGMTCSVLPSRRMLAMADDDPFYNPTLKPLPARVARPGELLFEFVRASDRASVTCELRFNGESYGWEAQFSNAGSCSIVMAGSLRGRSRCSGPRRS